MPMRNYTKSTTQSDHGNTSGDIKVQLTNFGNQTTVSTDDILSTIDRLPAFHLQRLKEITYDPQRLLQKIIQDDLEPLHRDAKGVFIQSRRTIAIHEIESKEHFFHVLLHELGHHVYFQVIGTKLKKQWVTKVCRKDKFITAYAATNAAEDFAECYVAYLMEPDRLSNIALKFVFFREHVFNNHCYILQNDRIDFKIWLLVCIVFTTVPSMAMNQKILVASLFNFHWPERRLQTGVATWPQSAWR